MWHMLTGRNVQFPPAQAPYVYAHDPITATALKAFHRQAKVLAGVLGGDEVVGVTESPWHIADGQHARFAEEINEDIVNDGDMFVNLGIRGVAMVDGDEVFCEQVPHDIFDDLKEGRLPSEGG